MADLNADEVSLLCRLCDDGPLREDVVLDGSGQVASLNLVRRKLVEVVFGRDRSLLRATFAGKKLRAEWREAAREVLERDGKR